MNVLYVTPRYDKNDELMAFLYYWIKSLSKRNDKSLILVLKGKKMDVNKTILTLEKYPTYLKPFYLIKYMIIYNSQYDIVFIFMYPLLGLIAGLIAKLLRKKIVFYYAHGSVSFLLYLSTLLSDRIVTTSEKGFNINTPKKIVISQGINTELFKSMNLKRKKEILYVGRISKIKRIEMILDLLRKHPDWTLRIVGPVMDKNYYNKLIELIKKHKLNVIFEGPVPYTKLPLYYNKAQIFINPSLTGSLDKTVLEAWACELPVLTSNPAYFSILKSFNLHEKYYFKNQKELEEKFNYFLIKGFNKFEKNIFKKIAFQHSYVKFVNKLYKVIEELI